MKFLQHLILFILCLLLISPVSSAGVRIFMPDQVGQEAEVVVETKIRFTILALGSIKTNVTAKGAHRVSAKMRRPVGSCCDKLMLSKGLNCYIVI